MRVGWLDEPLGRAELTVSLDYPRWLSLQRQVRSMLARLIDGRLICNEIAKPFGSFSGGIPSLPALHVVQPQRQRIRQWITDPSARPVLAWPRRSPAIIRTVVEHLLAEPNGAANVGMHRQQPQRRRPLPHR
jgi:hypothetical protein